MDVRDFVLSAVMVFSAAILVYRWLSLYNRVDATVIFFAALLVASLALLLLSMEFRMQRIMGELQSVKRTIIVNSDDLEGRMEKMLDARIKLLEERLESMERRMYR